MCGLIVSGFDNAGFIEYECFVFVDERHINKARGIGKGVDAVNAECGGGNYDGIFMGFAKYASEDGDGFVCAAGHGDLGWLNVIGAGVSGGKFGRLRFGVAAV